MEFVAQLVVIDDGDGVESDFSSAASRMSKLRATNEACAVGARREAGVKAPTGAANFERKSKRRPMVVVMVELEVVIFLEYEDGEGAVDAGPSGRGRGEEVDEREGT